MIPRRAVRGAAKGKIKEKGGQFTDDNLSQSTANARSFKDAKGKTLSGEFVVRDGIVTVTARDGRTLAAEINLVLC